MNQNEKSAEALRIWLKDQQSMQEKATQQRDRLVQLRDPSSNGRSWLDDAIENVQGSIDHLAGSMDKTKHLIGLADENRLHDPMRG